MITNDIKEQLGVDYLLQLALKYIEDKKYSQVKKCICLARERLGFKKFMEDLSGASMCPIEELEDVMSHL